MNQDKPKRSEDLRAAVAKGAAWMVALRWSIRGIGLLSTMILVRLLNPEDFGLVAVATLFVGLLDVLTSFGVDTALIQRRD